MAEARRKCDHDFREGAVRIVRETGKPIAQVARELRQRGHPEELGDAGPASAGHRERGTGEDERAELARLRRECAELRMRLAMETASCPDAGRLGVERALELAARLRAARAASAAAATSLMTLGLPIAASVTARSTTIPATLIVWAGLLLLGGLGERAGTGHGSERVGVSLGEPERDAAQFVDLGDDAADRHLMLRGVLMGPARRQAR